jgi:molybdopterin molybdotransferase
MAGDQNSDTSISFREALAAIARAFQPATGTQIVPLAKAHGRILAADITAPIAVPATDNSAVDGYAFRHADLPGPLRVVGSAAAGRPYAQPVGQGEAIRIFTGAIMPEGADTVAPQEIAAVTGATLIVPDMRLGANRRRAGEDIAPGSRIRAAGERLDPAKVGVIASVGIAEVSVRAPLRLAVFSTGDELRDGDGPLGPGQIYDSNRPVLMAMLGNLGIAATDLGILPDRQDIIAARLAEAARTHDAVICSAGMSVGDEDHVKAAVRSLGALDFWSVAIKPGRPIAVGRIGATPFFGLPGNPVAMIVTFQAIVRPALLRLAGAAPGEPRRFPVTADFSLTRRPGKHEFLRCTLHENTGHTLLARRFARAGSGVLSSVADGEGLLEVAEDIAEIAPGMTLPFIPFSCLGL